LTLPSFADGYRNALLNLLAGQRAELTSHSRWIIDVRGNDGGSDSTFEPLLPWLLPDGYVVAQAEWWVTAYNIAAQSRVCPLIAPRDRQCAAFARQAIERMRTAKFNTFVLQEPAPPLEYQRVASIHERLPQRVAVLIDRGCVSSCEEFLLAVRQGFVVKLLGQRTGGALDYANMRPRELPSGRRRLWYATSRSTRLPGNPIDGIGVQPDVYLPVTENSPPDREILAVQKWLESGAPLPRREVTVP
jgi:C-terminal processing protease CtpA/Prc